MKRWILAAGLCLIAALAVAAELAMFTGEAQIDLGKVNVTAARRLATRDALIDALQKALAQIAPAEELELKSEGIRAAILDTPDRYVAGFSILAERTDAAMYYLTLEARVPLDDLRRAVRDIAAPRVEEPEAATLAILPFQERPGGYSLVAELDAPLRERFDLASQNPAPVATAEKLLASPSFAVAARDNRFEDLARVAAMDGLRILVMVRVTDQTDPIAPDNCDRTAKTYVVDAQGPSLLGTFQYRYPASGACEGSTEDAAREIFAGAVGLMAEAGKLTEAGARPLVVEFTGVRDFDVLNELGELLRAQPDVQSADLESFETGGRVRFAIVYGGAVEQLAARLGKIRSVGFSLQEAGRSATLLRYDLESK